MILRFVFGSSPFQGLLVNTDLCLITSNGSETSVKMKGSHLAVFLLYSASLEICSCLASHLENYFYLLQTFDDRVGAGNYTYFKLAKNGNIRIYLETLKGDADIYVSESSLKPTYDNYDLESVTCGDDFVDISDSFKRPTAIAIYGHPRFEESYFRCSVYVDTRDTSKSDYDYLQQDLEQPGLEPEEEYPGWALFLKVMEFVLEVAL